MRLSGQKVVEPGFSAAIMSVGERTEKAARDSLLPITDKVCVVRDVSPLYQALRQSYQYGIEANREWMILIGADTVLHEGEMRKFTSHLKHYPKTAYCVSAYLQCKLRTVGRTGVFAYRHEHLPLVVRAISKCHHEIRPQGAAHIRMGLNGLKHIKYRKVVGIHDYEQYHYDIYRTAHLLALKWQRTYINNCMMLWDEGDVDYRTAALAINNGGGEAGIPDVRTYDRKAIWELLSKHGIKEKRALRSDIQVDTLINRNCDVFSKSRHR